MKAILVIEMPSSCSKCEFCLEITENHHCCQRVADDNEMCKRVDYEVELYQYEKPSWCPLRELPEKANHPDWCDGGRYDKGFNDCIDEIMKGRETDGKID